MRSIRKHGSTVLPTQHCHYHPARASPSTSTSDGTPPVWPRSSQPHFSRLFPKSCQVKAPTYCSRICSPSSKAKPVGSQYPSHLSSQFIPLPLQFSLIPPLSSSSSPFPCLLLFPSLSLTEYIPTFLNLHLDLRQPSGIYSSTHLPLDKSTHIYSSETKDDNPASHILLTFCLP